MLNLFDYASSEDVIEEPAKEPKAAKATEKHIKVQKNQQVLEALSSNIELEALKFVCNPVTEREYTGNNAIMLELITAFCGWSHEYAGFNQWKQIGRKVKSGEKAIYVLMPCMKKNDEGEQELAYYKNVPIFNRNQTEAIN